VEGPLKRSMAYVECWLPNRGKTGHSWELAVPLA
jgi:hypothetical protein